MNGTMVPLEYASDEFIASRVASAQATRQGEPAGMLCLIAAMAGGFARLSGSVERWARRPGVSEQVHPAATTTQAGW